MTKPDSVQPLMTSPRAMGASLGRQKETMTLDQNHNRMQPWISMDFLISRCLYVAVEMLLQTMFVLRNDPTPHQESTDFSSFSRVFFSLIPYLCKAKNYGSKISKPWRHPVIFPCNIHLYIQEFQFHPEITVVGFIIHKVYI